MVYEKRSPLLLKISKDQQTAQAEATALNLLREHQAPVPQLVDYDPQGILILEWLDGTAWGNLSQKRAGAAAAEVVAAYSRLQHAWQQVAKPLRPLAVSNPQAGFEAQMKTIGDWICSQAPDPQNATRVWHQLLQLATSQEQTFGSLDYNPYNLILTAKGPVFVDFESYGMDWDTKRLLQYSTSIRTAAGEPCFRPILRRSLCSTPADDAHFILFATVALHRQAKLRSISKTSAFFGKKGSPHEATQAWRTIWANNGTPTG